LTHAAAGRTRVAVVEGEPGIGKTRLATQVTELAAASGLSAVTGRCREDEGAPPYWPWIQILRALLGDDAAAPRTATGLDAEEIAALIPELADRLPGAAAPGRAPAELERPDARFRSFEAIARYLRRRAEQRPLALFLDDLGWADSGSLLLLEFVVAHCLDSSLFLLITCRDGASGRAARVSPTLAAMAAYDHVWRLALSGLSETNVASMMAGALGRDAPVEVVRELHAQTGGNPLFVSEAIRLMAREGAWAAGPGWPGALIGHGRVEEAIAARIGRLSDECRHVLGVAALLGERFRVQPLARLVDAAGERVVELLAEGEATGIVIARPHQKGRWGFAHGLMRAALVERFPTSERRRWHQRIGEVLEALYEDEAELHASELAHHFVQAAPGPGVDRAVRYSIVSARQATARFADEDAAAHYRQALEVLELSEQSDARKRCELLVRLGEAATRSGDTATAKESLTAGIGLARHLRAPELLARAALASARGDDFQRPQKTASLLEEALAGLPADTPLRARVLSRLARALHSAGQSDRSAAVAQEAIEAAQLTGPSGALSMALYSASYFDWAPEGRPRRLAAASRLIDLAERERQPEAEFTGHWSRLTSFLSAGDIAAVDREITACARLAEEIRQPFYRKYVTLFRGMRAMIRGDFAAAEQEAERALEIGRDDDDTVFAVASLLGIIRKLQGDRTHLLERIERFAEIAQAVPALGTGVASDLLDLGRVREARAAFEAFAANRFASLPRDFTWLSSMDVLAHVCCGLGDAERADVLTEELAPYADAVAVGGPAIAWGTAVAYTLGRLATVRARYEEGAAYFEAALSIHERMGARPYVALTQRDYALLLGRRGKPGDRDAASRRLTEAIALGEMLGMRVLVEEARQELGLLGGGDTTEEPAASAGVASPSAAAARYRFHREGEYWTIVFEGRTVRARDRKGLQHLARLLAEPSRGFHALELLGVSWRTGTSGPLLDQRAREDYRRRLSEIESGADEAEAQNDAGRVERANAERAALIGELARASGLNGRDRGELSDAERARLVVTKRIKSAIQLLRKLDPNLGRHLDQRVHTGYVCVYGSLSEATEPWQL
jgi:tetratricopeptide (TPR) repeat protein